MFTLAMTALTSFLIPGFWFWPEAFALGSMASSWYMGFALATRLIDVIGIVVIIVLLARKQTKRYSKNTENVEAAK